VAVCCRPGVVLPKFGDQIAQPNAAQAPRVCRGVPNPQAVA